VKQKDFAELIDSLTSRGEPFAVATVVRTEGSTMGKPGFKVVISGAGEVLWGTIGGACPESAIVAATKMTMRTGNPKMVKVFLEGVGDAVGAVLKSQSADEIHLETNCGGTMEIHLEPNLPQQRLVLIGQGGKDDVEDALVRMAKVLDIRVVVIDHSPVLSEQPDQQIKDADFNLSTFSFSDSDFVVVLTKGERDVETLQALSKFKLRYVGMVASLKRARENFAKLREIGVKEEFIASVKAPVGADIGAITAGEIALSIMSEAIATKYGKDILSRAHLGQEPERTEESEGQPVDTKVRARRAMLLNAGYSDAEIEGMGDLSAMASERFGELVKTRWRRPGDADG
jgi:xanthine dehydrogenase accessory factor